MVENTKNCDISFRENSAYSCMVLKNTEIYKLQEIENSASIVRDIAKCEMLLSSAPSDVIIHTQLHVNTASELLLL